MCGCSTGGSFTSVEAVQAPLDGKSIGGYVRGLTSGSTTAGPIWGNTFKAIAQWLPDDDFVRPSSSDVAGLLIPVPSVSGLSYDDAKARVEAAGFTAVRGPSRSSGVARGLVAFAYPGEAAGEGDTITLYLSRGPKKERKPKGGGGGGGGGKPGDGNNGRGND